jgi:hypothetical protein
MDAQYGQFFDQVSFTRLIFVSAAFTALCWLLVPLLKLAEIERGQRAGQLKESGLIIDSAENPPLPPLDRLRVFPEFSRTGTNATPNNRPD